ncbi:LLM class flavin-dependent oxidoreductase [Frigidibacter sp. MR17.14]|uniref:LLM class flavin-dependent oxidoreductase n=1 Tax=Frigidibacter sp. MR17.14 TaxID=3126509 RepID=UPI003012CC18
MSSETLPYSLLDLAPVPEGLAVSQALQNVADLAAHAEALGYRRFWLAEHHNMEGIASAATSVLIGHVLGKTSKIRVGSGGIMLPNHAPLQIAEQFGTLAELYGPRVDLGLGRAPGTDGMTMRALRRGMQDEDQFPQDVVELMGFLGDRQPGQPIIAQPGMNSHVPVWMLGSSLYGAQLAAMLGLPYAFASHFAPAALEQAIEIYRRSFRPSASLERPHFMLAINVFAGEDDAEGHYLRSSALQQFANLRLGTPGKLPRPVENVEEVLPRAILPSVKSQLAITAVGGPATVARELQALVDRFEPDEVILTGQIHDHAKRKRSFEIAAEAMQRIAAPVAA